MPEHDILKMYVKFYDNHGQLKQVNRKSGVPLHRLRVWLDGGILADADCKLLWGAVERELVSALGMKDRARR